VVVVVLAADVVVGAGVRFFVDEVLRLLVVVAGRLVVVVRRLAVVRAGARVVVVERFTAGRTGVLRAGVSASGGRPRIWRIALLCCASVWRNS